MGFETERGGDGKDWLGVKFSLLEFFIENFIGVDGWMGMMGGGLGFDTFLGVNRGVGTSWRGGLSSDIS